ncbi:unnamed protein product [Adineta ricciae]|uniref:Uncharacterized protein n=1 Tax=Adineta ricciae TaxID=249248 RepID=A0A813XBP9_ADIRI|nr:unnamed protein product [Adineta ricciae]
MDENNSIPLTSQMDFTEEEDDDDIMTSQELFQRLQQAWLNEKYSPVLLKHENLLVLATFELLDDIEKRLKASEHKTTSFRWLMHRTEYNRLYFILCSYIRTRCFKIEEYPAAALNSEELLSPEECVYAHTYLNNMKQHLKKSVLTELKSEQQQQNDDNGLVQLLPKPNLNEFAFFRVDQSVNGVILSNEQNHNGTSNDIIDFRTDDQYIMQFRHIHKILYHAMTSSLDNLTSKDVKNLLHDKYILILGDSVVRGLYKDLIKFYNSNDLISEDELRIKGENRFSGDRLISGGIQKGLTNGIDYEEVREYSAGGRLRLRFYFLTKCYSSYVKDIIFNDIKSQAVKPDMIIMNSCVWDMSRYGTCAMRSYQRNLEYIMNSVRQMLPNALFLWLSALPVSNSSRGGVMVPSAEYIRPILPGLIRDGNYRSLQTCHLHSVLYIDLHSVFSTMLHLRRPDGIHWLPVGIRLMNEILLNHVMAYYHGVQNFKCPSLRRDLGNKINVFKQRLREYSQRTHAVQLDQEIPHANYDISGKSDPSKSRRKRMRDNDEEKENLQSHLKVIVNTDIEENRSRTVMIQEPTVKQRKLDVNESVQFDHNYCDIMYDNEFEGLNLLHYSPCDIEESENLPFISNIQEMIHQKAAVRSKQDISTMSSQSLLIPCEQKKFCEPDYIILSSDDDDEPEKSSNPASCFMTILPIYLLNRLY